MNKYDTDIEDLAKKLGEAEFESDTSLSRKGKNFDIPQREIFLSLVRRTGDATEACKTIGVNYWTVFEVIKRDPEFKLRYNLAKQDHTYFIGEVLKSRLKSTIIDRALGYMVTETYTTKRVIKDAFGTVKETVEELSERQRHIPANIKMLESALSLIGIQEEDSIYTPAPRTRPE